MSKKTRSASCKAYFLSANQGDTAVKNRESRLERHVLANPNDTQSAKMVGKLKYRRGSSHGRNGWADMNSPAQNCTLRTAPTKNKAVAKPIDCMAFKPSQHKAVAQDIKLSKAALNLARFDRTQKWIDPSSV